MTDEARTERRGGDVLLFFLLNDSEAQTRGDIVASAATVISRRVGATARTPALFFYFRDDTFECICDDWQVEPDPANELFHLFGPSEK
jgi:hypothetical protein